MFGCPVIESSKRHADGKGPSYDYTPDGKLSRRVWARGIATDYTYDNAGNLTRTEYDDNGVTPTITMSYDRVGNLVNATTAGVVTNLYAYDLYGHCTNEWQNDFHLTRFYDTFGRNTGYAINGTRQTTIAYDSVGRIATMQTGGTGVSPVQGGDDAFQWTYLPGSDLKSSLTYPNGLTASWTYDANNQLLQVRNATPTNVISQFDYTYDAAGRRIEIAKSGSAFEFDDVVSYGYNARNELTNAVASVDANYRYNYQYDPIGNRETSSERGTNTTYAANELNQYTQIAAEDENAFIPKFDDDGNQTIVKTATGIWQVTYNGENRPVLWICGPTNIVMSYDRMGRRVTKNNQLFVYDGYLQVYNYHFTTTTSENNYFLWDPTEPVATRPLVWNRAESVAYYTHDGNKNVSEVVLIGGMVIAQYYYTPFGATAIWRDASAFTNFWRFSSEFADDELGCDYFNFREYESAAGRWMERDKVDENGGNNLYEYCINSPINLCDRIGLYSSVVIETHQNILKHAVDSLVVEGRVSCLQNPIIKDYVLGVLQVANVGMDKGLYARDEYLYLHFNRTMKQGPVVALMAYVRALSERRSSIDKEIEAGGYRNCKDALKSIGELTHMTQDYWGHGVSWEYEVNPQIIETGDPLNPFMYNPGYPPDSVIGYASGYPDDPKMKPSSYAGAAADSEHGPIYGREPGNRAPDGTGFGLPIFWDYSSGRLGNAVDYTKKDLRNYLGAWCEKCCVFLSMLSIMPYYFPF